ncbi:hypothetical protein FKO01_04130 [Mesorhizobium sp. B2-3-3]|nr:hypothetical protein FKO01_04130 [Mesorhizobium sp. B2-3-3]
MLGFSKGQTQSGALDRVPHDEMAYKGNRPNVGRILAHVGLVKGSTRDSQTAAIDRMIADRNGLFHFGSLIRCSVERHDDLKGEWKGSGGGMLDKFVATSFGSNVARNCATKFLGNLSEATRMVIMFGMGTQQNYVRQACRLLSEVRGSPMRRANEIAYEDDRITVVHVEHFASQGDLIPQWLGEGQYKGHDRAEYGRLAARAVNHALERLT